MPSSNKRRVAAVTLAFTLFVLTLGLVYFIEVEDLFLSSYLQSVDNEYKQTQRSSINSTTFEQSFQQVANQSEEVADQSEERREMQLVLDKFARSSSLYSNITIRQKRKERYETKGQLSPACHPHFRHLASRTTWTWSDTTKFKRIYFYHTRKAGGTSLAHYFFRVADNYGLEFDHGEWFEAEEPGTHELPTFYITHLREPVARSISHFKYQGRWSCRDLIKMRMNNNFTATEETAMKIDTWNTTGGHIPFTCSRKRFKLGACAVNCYTQWFSGACPEYNTTISQQYQVAMVMLLRYNFIVVLEWMKDPDYVSAVEQFFGVPGFGERRAAYCERASHRVNSKVPLAIRNDTVEKLFGLNKVDIRLYNEITNCMDKDAYGKRFDFPLFDANRFKIKGTNTNGTGIS